MKTYGKIVSCKARKSKKGDKQLVIGMIVRDQHSTSEDLVDRFFRVFSYPTRSEGAMPDLQAFFHACGISGGKVDPSTLTGRVVGLKLEQREWQGSLRWSVGFAGYFLLDAKHQEKCSQMITDFQRAAGSQPTSEADKDDFDFTVDDDDEDESADSDDNDIAY